LENGPSGQLAETGARAATLPAPPVSAASLATPWTTITCETFEGTWPAANWQTFDGDSPPSTNGEYCWNDVTFQAYQSNKSAWPAAGCANAITPGPGQNYPSNANSWMVYGPFSLADALDAEVRFQLWYSTESCCDGLFWGTSTDGQHFRFDGAASGSGTTISAPTNMGWNDVSVDLKSVYDVLHSGNAPINLLGQQQVWMAWAFISDGSTTKSGTFVDNVHIHKLVGTAATPTPSVTGTPPTPTKTGTPVTPVVTGTPSMDICGNSGFAQDVATVSRDAYQRGSSRGTSGSQVVRPAAVGGLQTTDLTTGLNAVTLANTLVGGAGVSISNAQFKGALRAAGLFSGGTTNVGIESGVILSSGNIAKVVGPNTSDSISQSNGCPGDSDLNTLIPGYQTQDATVLEFDFVPQSGSISFQYVFASDEYNEFVNTPFNDVFGFFLNGTNVALIPGTTTAVAINNVNNGNPLGNNPHNAQYYRNNDLNDGGGSINTEMDGMTVVLSVNAPVNAGVQNHIKLAIADAGDTIYDSNVFLKAGSFASGCAPIKLSPATPSVVVGSQFDVDVVVDATCQVDRVEAYLNFDPQRLQVVDNNPGAPGAQLAPGTALPEVLVNTADNTLGTINFVARKQTGPFPSASFTVATIRFQAISVTGQGGAPVPFIFDLPGNRFTTVQFNGSSVFGGATDGVVTVNTPTPTGTPPTATPSATGGTPTHTPTNTPTPTNTRTPTPTVSPTPLLSGRNFNLNAGDRQMAWLDSSGDSGYFVLRWAPPDTFWFLPSPVSPLSSSATSFTDSTGTSSAGSGDEVYCYVLLVTVDNPPTLQGTRALSDLLCVYPGSGSGDAPTQFNLRLNQSNVASLTWNTTGSRAETAYRLVVTKFNGTAPITLPLNAVQFSTQNSTGGVPTCYALQAINVATVIGTTDTLCAVPGIASVASAGMGTSANDVINRARQLVASSGVTRH
jgi:hypothetical protein